MPGLCGLVFMHQEAAMGNRHTDGHRCVLVNFMRTGRQLVSGHTAALFLLLRCSFHFIGLLSLLSSTPQDHPTRASTIRSVSDPFTAIVHQVNATKTCLQAAVVEGFFSIKNFSFQMTLAYVKQTNNKQTNEKTRQHRSQDTNKEMGAS